MINLVSNNHIQEMFETRRKKYVLDKSLFYILTPENHVFWFDSEGDLSVVSPNLTKAIHSPEALEIYGLSYGEPFGLISNLPPVFIIKNEKGGKEQIKTFYKSCITDPAYMFFLRIEENELKQELQYRGLI